MSIWLLKKIHKGLRNKKVKIDYCVVEYDETRNQVELS
jgi:hypothetical protein